MTQTVLRVLSSFGTVGAGHGARALQEPLVEIGEATEARRPGGATGTPCLTSQRIEVGDQFFDRRV